MKTLIMIIVILAVFLVIGLYGRTSKQEQAEELKDKTDL
jgi:type II secretory pathway pseudopilin PulG